MRRCDGFRQLTDPIFVVIIWFAQKVTHLASLRAHLRMQTTIPNSFLAVHQHQRGLFLANESPVHPWGHRSPPMLLRASVSPHHCWMAFVQHHSIPHSIWWSALHTARLPEYSFSGFGCVFLGYHLDHFICEHVVRSINWIRQSLLSQTIHLLLCMITSLADASILHEVVHPLITKFNIHRLEFGTSSMWSTLQSQQMMHMQWIPKDDSHKI